jgi:hypothetical protein
MATTDPRDQGYSSNPQPSYRDRLRANAQATATETVVEEDPVQEAATQKEVASRPAVTSEPW